MGGVISPLLANIYLHELDQFMGTLKSQYDRGIKRRRHPEWKRLSYTISNRQRSIKQRIASGRGDTIQPYLDDIRACQAEMKRYPSVDLNDPNYRRLMYVRYADDFLIGINGPKQEARDVMAQVTAFLRDALHLNVSAAKSGINSAAEGANFLGYEVRTDRTDRVQKYRPTHANIVATRRDADRTVKLHLPREKLAAFAERQRLGNYHTIRGEPRYELKDCSDAEIIVAMNAVIRGLAEFYKLGSDWKHEFSPLHHVWWFSLMKTLACKHKCSVRHVVRELLTRHQGDLGVWFEKKNEEKVFLRVFTMKEIKSAKPVYVARVDAMPSTLPWGKSTTDMVDRLRARACEACGATNVPLEIHHVRRMADMQDVTLRIRQRAARARKRAALCLPCHDALHVGTLEQRLHQVGRV